MEEQVKEPNSAGRAEGTLTLSTWLGRRQAFGMIVNRCTATDAECLKQMRDSGKYKNLGMTWVTFCQEWAGANYFRLSELMQISSETYQLIAGAVSEEGVEVDGKRFL